MTEPKIMVAYDDGSVKVFDTQCFDMPEYSKGDFADTILLLDKQGFRIRQLHKNAYGIYKPQARNADPCES